jgi:EAL and modified HD-GYP domain-containing signal transduction protein
MEVPSPAVSVHQQRRAGRRPPDSHRCTSGVWATGAFHPQYQHGAGIRNTKEFKRCVKAGCDLLGGGFLFRPTQITNERIPPNLNVVTKLIRTLADLDVDFGEVEAIVKTDPALGVGVLRLLGSAAFGLSREVTSVRHAISLLGLQEFGKWVTVVALAQATQQPSELGLVALTRARGSEVLATATGLADPDEAFTAGLISALDALCGQPLPKLLEELPVAKEIRSAVLGFEGPLGRIVAAISGRDDGSLVSSDFQPGVLNRAWFEAVNWAEEARSTVA